MVQNKKVIKIVGFLFALGICVLLLLYIFSDKKDNAKENVVNYNTFFDNSEIIFSNSLGDIYIPTNQDYMLKLFFRTNEQSEINFNNIIIKDTVIDFGISDIKIIDYSVELDEQVKNGYALNLYLRINTNCTNKINNIYINNKKFNIGKLNITSQNNDNFIIKSNVAIGSSFKKYFADFTNSSAKDIKPFLLSCGSLDVANPTYEIKNSKETYLDNFIINKDKNEIYTITVYFDRKKISSDIETIYVSPRFSYKLNGKTLIYYFPYSMYK